MNQIERKIKEMEEVVSNITYNYIGVDVSSAESRMGFEKGRGLAFFEALAVISVLQAEIRRLQTQQFRDDKCLSLPEIGKKYRKKFDDSEGSWRNIWECVEFASTTLNEGKRVYLHQINGYGKTAPFLEDFLHQFVELVENEKAEFPCVALRESGLTNKE